MKPDTTGTERESLCEFARTMDTEGGFGAPGQAENESTGTPTQAEDGVLAPESSGPPHLSLSPHTYVGWYGNKRSQNWQTPPGFFAALDDEFGFTIDGASELGNALLPRASTAEHPLPWNRERVFCNPPWSNIRPFVELAATADLAVLLVPARTNAKWFHRALELGASVRFFPGRIKFVRPGRQEGPGHNSPVDCVLLVFENVSQAEAA